MAENDLIAQIRKLLTKQVVIAFLLGAIVGLVVLGWWLWPVKWINADPADLRPSAQETYLQMIADAYAATGNAEVARARLESLKAPGEKDANLSARLEALVRAKLDAGKADEAQRLKGLVSAAILPPSAVPQPTPTLPAARPANRTLRTVGILFFLLLLAAGVILLLTQLQRREAVRRRRVPTAATGPFVEAEEEGPEAGPAPENALGHLETTYVLGDVKYSVSAGLGSGSAEFPGEFGIDAVEDVDLGEEEGIQAFEVWLFDKQDVRTETKVLLSERAFADSALQEELAKKGELIQARPGQVVTLDTANLHLDATIRELEYTDETRSSFARLTTNLDVSAR
jgi:hypothetical protein